MPSTSSQLDLQSPNGNTSVSMCSSKSDSPKTFQKSAQNKKNHKRKSETPVPSAAKVSTVFTQSDVAVTIYFIMQFCAASIREWRLLKALYQHIAAKNRNRDV